MKKILLFAFLLYSGMLLNAQIVNIPDANFKNHLLDMDDINTNGDGEIQLSEAIAAQTLEISEHPQFTGLFSTLEGIDAFANLTYLGITCSMTNIDLSGLSQLTSLMINTPQLSVIDLTGLDSLETISMSMAFNLSVLDVSNLNNLKSMSLSFADNLSSLLIGNNTNFKSLSIDTDSLAELDLSGCPNLTSVSLGFNTQNHDVFINLKNGNPYQVPNSSAISASNFNGTYSHLCYVCMDEGEAENFEFLDSGIIVSSYCSFTPGGEYNVINGTLTFDSNNNGCDASNVWANHIKVKIQDATDSGVVHANTWGAYNFYPQAGNYIVTPQFENDFFTANPAFAEINFTTVDSTVVTRNFCLSANGMHPDVEVLIVSEMAAQPGFNAMYKVVFKNKGNQMLSGNVTVNYDDAIIDYVYSSPVASESPGIITWTYNDLLPFETRELHFYVSVHGPMDTPPINLDDVLTFTASITPVSGDETPSDNTFEFSQVVVGSFDPNDITCLQGKTVSPEKIGEYLHYNINFENTGTAPATFIVVKDVIDEAQFDVSSLQLIDASHNVETKVTGNKVEFIFDDINLAGAGKGNVVFKIKTLNSLAVNTDVTQKANIYFDYNWPIETNDATTMFGILSNDGFQKDASVKIYPNPAVSVVNLTAASEIKSVQLFDVQGRVLETLVSGNENSVMLDVSSRASGLYFIKVITEQGSKVEKFVKK